MKKLVHACVAAIALIAFQSSHATVLDFTGANSGTGSIANTYGDSPLWDVTYLDVNGGQTLQTWGVGYIGTTDVLWVGPNDPDSWGRITITPTAGHQISLASFDLSPYLGSYSSDWAAYTLGGAPTFTTGQINGLTTINSPLTSTAGVVIEWKNSAYNVGIDNINFSVTAAVPEPETYSLMFAGLGMLGALARRRKKA